MFLFSPYQVQSPSDFKHEVVNVFHADKWRIRAYALNEIRSAFYPKNLLLGIRNSL